MKPILILEEDKVLGELMKRYLKDFNVELLNNGKAAVDKIVENHPYQGIIVNLSLKNGVDAITFLKMLKKFRGSEIPFLVISPSHSAENKQLAKSLGAKKVISQPFAVPEFLEAVSALLQPSPSFNLYDLEGKIQEFSLQELMELFRQTQKSGIVEISHQSQQGILVFHNGSLVRAQLQEKRGRDAVFEMAEWPNGHFGAFFGEVPSLQTSRAHPTAFSKSRTGS
ncbi:MAG: response regulator [Planctomycetota bacterium]|nr:MAG: response regulator [Planctomycetota bacterium]